MLMASLLFVLPGERPEFLGGGANEDEEEGGERRLKKPVPPVLLWKTVQHKFPWDIVFLIAGGFALAAGSTRSGFSTWMGEQLTFLDKFEPWIICLIVTCLHVTGGNASECHRFQLRSSEGDRPGKSWLVDEPNGHSGDHLDGDHVRNVFLGPRNLPSVGSRKCDRSGDPVNTHE